MASKKSAAYPYQWANGEWHSTPQGGGTTVINQSALAALLAGTGGPAKGTPRPETLPPPPPGTYDPAIDYNAGGSQRGYENTRDDAATSYTQGQEDYGLNLGDLTTGRDRTLADLGTQKADVQHQYGILGGQQAEHAAQAGVTSAGLLGKSAAVRGANEAHDIAPIDLAVSRTGEDFTRNKLGLDLTNSRNFGGYGGNTILNPLTGQPAVGSLLTGLTRAGGENNAYQTFSAGQRSSQAAASGYIAPSLLGGPGPTAAQTSEFARRAKLKGLLT